MSAEISTAEILVEVERGLRTFKAFEHAQKILSGLQNAEQVAKDTWTRIETLKAEQVQVENDLQAAQAEVERAKTHAGEIISKAANAAIEKKDQVATEIAEQRAEFETEKAELAETIEDMRGVYNDVCGRRTAATLELAALTDKIAEAKAQIAKLLGD